METIKKIIELIQKVIALYKENKEEIDAINKELESIYEWINFWWDVAKYKAPKKLFNHLNQKSEERYRMACTIFAPVINLYYNTGIKLNYWHINTLIDRAVKQKTLHLTKWWALLDNARLVEAYAKELWHKDVELKVFNRDSESFDEFIEKGFMIEGWIGVNKDYLNDRADDWIINNTLNYEQYSGNKYLHATNFYKWQDGSEWCFDSYFGNKKHNNYNVDIEETRNFLLFPTCYTFIISTK